MTELRETSTYPLEPDVSSSAILPTDKPSHHVPSSYLKLSSCTSLPSSPSEASSLPNASLIHPSPYDDYRSTPSPRLNIPSEVMDLASGDKLQTSIIQLWRSSEPTETRKAAMEDLRILLTKTINDKFFPQLMEDGRQRFEVDIAGSTSWGGEIGPDTDVDFVILDRKFPKGYVHEVWLQPLNSTNPLSQEEIKQIRYKPSENPLLPNCYSLKSLSNCVEDIGMIATIRQPYLQIPLLKFIDPIRNLDCDLQCNDLTGVYNNSYILAYAKLSPYVLRPMINILKNWYNIKSGKKLKHGNKINKLGLSSYPICLMCIAYLQNIGYLPNLQKNIESKIYKNEKEWLEDEELVWVEWGTNRGLTSHTTFQKNLMVKEEEEEGENWKCLNSKFEKSKQEGEYFNTNKQIISPLNGGIISRSKNYMSHENGTDDNDDNTTNLDNQRNYLKSQNFDRDQIELILKQYKLLKNVKPDWKLSNEFGKCNKGKQPYRWSKDYLIIQDPLKWQKVN
uniref:Poly(A) RNA polymerase mitochondrial-like central palm domain-containing protein n=1 Tax=Kwoniella pini CBS 10737 TaxID=1296096 RepID=A0A1B9IC34_9TREE|nr:uncharacterized protein I206_00483 [Kwoniella pini CBS 10737]OCF53182.1 hypothetical protein I206_00483 [Kwoniella pini CBS 10737]